MYQEMTELKIAINELKEAVKEGIKGFFHKKGDIVPNEINIVSTRKYAITYRGI
jgi:hypothetical protein